MRLHEKSAKEGSRAFSNDDDDNEDPKMMRIFKMLRMIMMLRMIIMFRTNAIT